MEDIGVLSLALNQQGVGQQPAHESEDGDSFQSEDEQAAEGREEAEEEWTHERLLAIGQTLGGKQ